ncbi:uncharacterized protein CcaverHIS019_0500140 [Cutaneotrichosporon cavernicola]|uniref:FAD dependent oxidoreductase domain-containing protein n=1 Tax=Cutaneotrichosporon cavernicola TaxID=279322 RepID=A0AA48QWI2_9TREE|nr:uncharacterized protein CcaverHIS019_0500140 [Cutaneotrichosporon cavernicola]BEI92386.1 hypothetical protein CcaverHIS019_0500140 [Cutaneotrichosporon cavernicola]BEJ00157.1 hypothetical protein CcaverHIS631_0500140 [Cutaneotrichosporon cavernicola]BEJ07928.1 hypothetical protein CcaverHIS641_0500130 [Cutaneotrichosporon cavernicola]
MPCFPQPYTSTVSHWQQTNRGPKSLWDHGRDAKLPTEIVDYVIVGAGATGAALAYFLSRLGGAAVGKKVVILDAKDVASGASGRNGGHVVGQSWQQLTPLMAPLDEGGAGLSADDAIDVIMFEQSNIDLVESIVQSEGIDADFWRGSRVEVLRTPAGAADNLRNYELMRKLLKTHPKHKGRVLDWEIVTDPVAVKKLSRTRGAVQANRIPGGSWHPHKGVTAFLRLALESKSADVSFYSWAPVAGFSQEADGTVTVDCAARGKMRARNVILATNAYTQHVLPELKDILVPVHSHSSLITSPASYAGPRALQTTFGLEAGSYVIQTPDSGLVVGPYPKALFGSRILKPDQVYGIDDDSFVRPEVKHWLANHCRDTFVGWGKEADGEGLTKCWTGIIGHSVDNLPMVGAVPGRPGVWIAAGYNGRGMALIHSVTRGLAHQLKTGQWDERVPRTFQVSDARIKRARERALHPLDYPVTGLEYRTIEKSNL